MTDARVKAGTVTSLASKFGGMKKIVGDIKTKSRRNSQESSDHDSGIGRDSLASEQDAGSPKEPRSISGRIDIEGRGTSISHSGIERYVVSRDIGSLWISLNADYYFFRGDQISLPRQCLDSAASSLLSDVIDSSERISQDPRYVTVVKNSNIPSTEQKPTNQTRLWDVTAELRRQSIEEFDGTYAKTSADWAKEYQSLLDHSWLQDDQDSKPDSSLPRNWAASKPRFAALARAATGVIGKAGDLGAKSPEVFGKLTWDDLKYREDLEAQAGQHIRGEQMKLVNQGLVRICQKDWRVDDVGLTRITDRSNQRSQAM